MRNFGLPNLKMGNNERMGKGQNNNVTYITLVLVPRAQRMDQWHGKNPRSGNIKGAKATTKRHSAKKHFFFFFLRRSKEALDTPEKKQKRAISLKYSKKK